jgi:hypothetical protein
LLLSILIILFNLVPLIYIEAQQCGASCQMQTESNNTQIIHSTITYKRNKNQEKRCNSVIYEIMWKNMAEPDRLQLTT